MLAQISFDLNNFDHLSCSLTPKSKYTGLFLLEQKLKYVEI